MNRRARREVDRMMDGISSWADLFKRQELLNREQGARMNVYPLILAAIVCDAGGALEVTERALREAMDLRTHQIGMTPIPTGMQLAFLAKKSAPVPVEDAEPTDSTPSVEKSEKPSVWLALDEWKARVDRYVSDRRKLGGDEDPRAAAAEEVVQWLWDVIAGGRE